MFSFEHFLLLYATKILFRLVLGNIIFLTLGDGTDGMQLEKGFKPN